MPMIFTSTVRDGSMKSVDKNYKSVVATRTRFLHGNALSEHDTTLVQLTYGGNNYCRYATLSETDKGDGITRDATIVADALITTTANHALFLPLADCIGAVIHDPVHNVLMLSHLGRHNLEQSGGTKSIDYLVEKFGSNPKMLTVWLSPAAGGGNYPLYTFNNRSMHEVVTEQLCRGGIQLENITPSNIDTTKDPHYFSHSEFLKGTRDTDGRFAVVAVMS